ncbi:MAG: hypothetical protein MRZ96_00925 [Clostridium sp.]|nr:hypothetical protein [Clostridium sp.]MDY5895781.1 hypothetical protein [Oscillospiraceae bacterium]
MQQTKNRMPKGYLAMWIAISLAYLIWMVFFMKDIVLVNYATVAERTVDGVLHANISGMLGHEWLYPVWVVLSTVCLLMFIFYIKDILYAPQLTKAIKAFCLVGIIFGCVYVTWYGFFGDQPFIEKVKTITASMIGLDFPWHFRGWGVFASMTIFTNTMFAYRRYNYNSKLGVILGSIGSAAIFVTINCPSMGEEMHLDSPRCMAHWAGALIFAFCCAAPMVILLFSKARKEKGAFLAAFIIFCAILATMLVLLITVGKSAIIENIPMQAAYILLFLLNFTNIFEKKAAAKEAVAA